MPVQRVPRYELLLRELIGVTEHDHRDYANLTKAMELVKSVAAAINDSKREADGLMKIAAVQETLEGLPGAFSLLVAGRKLVRQGELLRDRPDAAQNCYVYLFSDALLVTQKRRQLFEQQDRNVFQLFLQFGSCKVVELQKDDIAKGFSSGFKIATLIGSDPPLIFYASKEVVAEWIRDLNEILPKALGESVLRIGSEGEPSTISRASSMKLGYSNSVKDLVNPVTSRKPTLKIVLELCQQSLQLQGELFMLPVELRTLIPSLDPRYVRPDYIPAYQDRIRRLSAQLQVRQCSL
jgi:hypothetical protein